MAFLKFSRDKRGYEHFALVEPTTNRRGTTRQRVLYIYRTPPDVKVGREPFDESVRRALEAQYPDVSFDWRKILETPIPSADAERWRERRRAERAARHAASTEAAGEAAEVDAAGAPEDLDFPTVPLEPPTEPLARGDVADSAMNQTSTSVSSPMAQAAPGDVARRRRRRRRGRRGRPEGAVASAAVVSGPASEIPGAAPDVGHTVPAEQLHESEPADTPTESAGD